jgi:flavin reductase (DIM6/NTAB) family NADH-FMN oxidoreductase RutF
MKKIIRIPQPLVPLFPVPLVLVSCGTIEKPNIVTIGWAGIVCSNPPQIGLGIRPERYSYSLIKKYREFVLNMATLNLIKEVDICGSISGRQKNKFSLAKLTPIPSVKVASPTIAECPVNTECRVTKILNLGSHSLFIGEVVSVQANEEVIRANSKWEIDFTKIDILCMNFLEYWCLGQRVGEAYKIDKTKF